MTLIVGITIFLQRRSEMSDKSINNNSDNSANDLKGTLLMAFIAILGISALAIGFWASQSGGGFN